MHSVVWYTYAIPEVKRAVTNTRFYSFSLHRSYHSNEPLYDYNAQKRGNSAMHKFSLTRFNVCRNKLSEHWQDLKGSRQHDCARVRLGVLRRWPIFGSQVFKCTMRWRNEEGVWLVVNDTGLHMLSTHTSAVVKDRFKLRQVIISIILKKITDIYFFKVEDCLHLF